MTSCTCRKGGRSPVSHGHLLQHGGAGVGLPVTRYRSSPETGQTHICSSVSVVLGSVTEPFLHIHVGFVVCADLLDSDVVLGVDEGLGGGVRLGQSHHAGYVLELHVVVHLHLDAGVKQSVHKSGRRRQ